jgi:phage terminase small subunit
MSDPTDKQRLFVAEYLVDLNAKQAAIRAGYSFKTAYSIGHENLKKPEVAAAIQQALDKRAERTRVTADKVVKELARLAFTDMRSFVRWGPHGFEFVDSDDLPKDETAAVTKVKLSPTQFGDRMEIELGHKDSALRMLAEHVGLFDSKGGSDDPLEDVARRWKEGMDADSSESFASREPEPVPEAE